MDDIKRVARRPRPPVQPPLQETQSTPVPPSSAPGAPIEPTPPQPENEPTPPTPKRRARLVRWIGIGLLGLGVLTAGVGFWWYQTVLSAVNPDAEERVLVVVEAGSTPTAIAAQLFDASLIRSTDAFLLYTRITGTQNLLQAGSYRLSQAQSVPDIVNSLTSGRVETFQVTFIPGQTLRQQRAVFEQAGYTSEEIDAAYAATYDVPFLADKPASSDLEGYIYPETYQVATGASAEDIIRQALTEFQRVIDENDLEAGFAAQDLTIFEGITLASIIEKEAVGGDEQQIAQVFLLRLEMGMPLGSDPTYQYIADKRGVPRDTNLNDPYNTRRFAGLPPGPIANAGLAALTAVTDPAGGDFVYFLSGDDNVTYFSRTLEEHERNIREKCQIKCQAL